MYLDEFFKDAPHIEIKQLSCDSRVPMKDCIFFCIKGFKYNGHSFVDEAIENGATVIVYSDDIDIEKNAVFIKVNDVDDVLNHVSSKFYDYPSSKLESYLVSGTNGRSSVSSIINMLISDQKKCGYIGVFGIYDGKSKLYTNQSTLPLLDNQKYLDDFVKNKCEVAIFEGKAIAFSYKKLDMLKPNTFIYTCTNVNSNEYKELGPNFYSCLRNYLYSLDNNTKVILNRDDDSYEVLSNASSENKVSYGMNEDSDYIISDIKCYSTYTSFNINHNEIYEVKTSLLGEANVYNLTAALVALNENGYPLNELIKKCEELKLIDGIYDRLSFDDYNIIVDCANNIESYNQILKYGNHIVGNTNKLFCLISINSSDSVESLNRSISLLDNNCDFLIITVDDAYEDDVHTALNVASSMIKNTNYIVVEDRECAIEEAIELLNKNDTLLILGKGNESHIYQGLVKKTYKGDKNIAYQYMNKRLKEEASINK